MLLVIECICMEEKTVFIPEYLPADISHPFFDPFHVYVLLFLGSAASRADVTCNDLRLRIQKYVRSTNVCWQNTYMIYQV